MVGGSVGFGLGVATRAMSACVSWLRSHSESRGSTVTAPNRPGVCCVVPGLGEVTSMLAPL